MIMAVQSDKLLQFVEQKIPMMGTFILKKQCEDLGIDYRDIPESRLKELADKMAKAVEMFLGYEDSIKLRDQIANQRFT